MTHSKDTAFDATAAELGEVIVPYRARSPGADEPLDVWGAEGLGQGNNNIIVLWVLENFLLWLSQGVCVHFVCA
jgi:hypothetical protein